MSDLIKVMKNGKYLGYATKEQLDLCESLAEYIEKKEPALQVEAQKDAQKEDKSRSQRANPSKIRKAK